MKILTLNFLMCARKACKSSSDAFPLHPRDVELEIVETDINPLFIRNILPRVEWAALRAMCNELGLPQLSETQPSCTDLFSTENLDPDATDSEPTQTLRDLHNLLVQTCIMEGKLVCGNCGHEYAIKEGIANFLLPSHMV
ncbi:Trm112p-domain-containing protein [Pseudovirgaria hyperparasitica]|uniref:Trm112p-domain-containing protein n=1 Tax=Pseudovirgaria hyperparasitica TaxID=470096 RepID=A0A6A6VU61_9PEZI|nr:Trm112p-domain-containing protein [Pseudovirgaria hyperparasitica]KAF2752781.1 Trm112p-domain-containing protein [Pseudovirgaria hyperparasitica]